MNQELHGGEPCHPEPASGPQEFDCLSGGGAMGGLMRSLDWTRTPLGPVTVWPQSLRTAVSICLNSSYPILLLWGPDLTMLYNDAYRPILGATKHPWAMGQRGSECWPEVWHIIGPMLHGVLEAGRPTWSEDQMLPLDRNGYMEECYFTFSYSPIREESGGVGGIFTVVSETTRRVLGERRLLTLRELAALAGEARSAEQACTLAARTLSASSADIPFALLYLLEDGGRIARLVGWSGLEPGLPASPRLVPMNQRGRSPWPLARAAQTLQPTAVDRLGRRLGALPGGPWPEPTRRAMVLPLRRPGQESPHGMLVAGVSPRRALDDDYRAFLSLVADHIATGVASARSYEEERARAEALAELDRAKTDFFSNVSHEFRTPLTLLLGPLEEARSTVEAGSPLDGTLELIHRNALRLLKLVNALLDFSRLEAGRIEASFEPVDLAALTADIASAFRSAIERAGMQLTVDCRQLSEPVWVDREMWEKIILNLLSNAFKFTLEGEISVRVRAGEEGAVVCVQDTGVGIPEDAIPRLFDRFHRIRGVSGRTGEGSGIGLALVKELVGLHHGAIRVESVVGQGSSFTVTIPTGTAHLPADRITPGRASGRDRSPAAAFVEETARWLPAQPAAREASQPDAQSRPLILLADDNADMRAYVTALLGPHFKVLAVHDGAAALAAAREQRPDLVLSDVMMPRLNGFELLESLRGDAATRDIPVILVSAMAGEEARIRGLSEGADDYLIKPFSARELIARVEAHLRMAAERRAAAEQLRRAKDSLEQRVAERTAEVRQLAEHLRALATELTQSEQRERRRIAKILHDHIQQLLVAAKIRVLLLSRDLDGAADNEHVALLRETLEEAVMACRSLTVEVSPPVLQDGGLCPALEWLASRMAEQHELHVQVDADADAEPESEDIKFLLFEAARELLFNARKHAAVDRARARLERRNGFVALIIEDDGAGFDPEASRAEKPTTGRFGLFSIEQRIRTIGGAIEIDSAPGRGTRVTLLAPASEAQVAAGMAVARPVRADLAAGAGGERVRILLADDHQVVRDGLRGLLQLEPDLLVVGEAADGEQAVELALRLRPDIVLMDISMPRLSGIEATARIARELTQTRVIGLSMHEDKGMADAMLEAGAATYLSKSAASEKLVEAIRACSPARSEPPAGMPGCARV